MTAEHSISQWIVGLKAGEMAAVQQLWTRFSGPLVELARRRLGSAPKRIADEEDVAQSVFLSLYRGAAAGRLHDVQNRDDLWWLLLAMTRRKAVDLIRRETAKKRGAGQVQSEGSIRQHRDGTGLGLDDLMGDDPTPELLAIMEDQNRRLMGLLDDDVLRSIAAMRIEGYTVPEMALECSLSTRSIERKLSLIRKIWTEEFVRGEGLGETDVKSLRHL